MNPTTLLSGLGAAITADPALGGASTSGRESDPGSGDLFLALVTGLLQGDGLTAPTPVPVDPTATAGAETETPAAGTGNVPAALPPVVTAGLVPLPAPSSPAQPGTAPETDEEPVADAATTDATEVSALPVTLAMTPLALQAAAVGAAVAASDDTDGTPTPVASVDTTTASLPQAGTPQAGSEGSTDQPTGDNDPAAPASADPSVPPAAAGSGSRTDARADAVPAPTAAAPTAVPSAPGVAPASAPAAVSAPTATPELPRVSDQVFPEVVRASAAGGTSRVTVKLNPEALGEVRVVLTQRGGELEVSIAAGSDARRALTEGAPELRRLLESVGRADSRIVIRDLPTGTPPSGAPPVPATAPATRTDVSTDLAGGPWSGAGGPGGEPAPDRDDSRHHPGSSTATDGIPSAAPASRPITTARRGHAGLDLSM